jgi:hypothetical protein
VSVFLDRRSFAALYEDVFNYCLRTVGSREPAAVATQRAFLGMLRQPQGDDVSVRLLVAARDAAAAPIGHAGPAPAVAVEDANRRLAPAHREVLALRDLVGCSYEAIAAVVGSDREGVAELLWRARLELRDRLAGSDLMSIAAVAEPCRRALPLIAIRLDGELEDAGERRRLQAHLRSCGNCRVSQDAMREAATAYRAWPPEQAPAELLLLLVEEARFSDPAAEPAA